MDEKIELEKNTDAEHYVRTFNKVSIYKEYKERLQKAINDNLLLDLITDIFIKDGNCIMSRDWFNELFKQEILSLKSIIDDFKELFGGNSNPFEAEDSRIRDYNVFRACVSTAFHNDEAKGKNASISLDELSVLQTLKVELGLSNEEARGIYYLEIGDDELNNLDIDEVIIMAKNEGLIFNINSKKTILVPDEFVKILRDIKGIPLADKFTRRILKALPDKQINKIKRNHGIKESEKHLKIEAIIKRGINIYDILSQEIYEQGDKTSIKMEFLKGFIEGSLDIHLNTLGRTVNDRIRLLVEYFMEQDNESNLGITRDGYDQLLRELFDFDNGIDACIREEFQIQPNVILNAETLLDYSIRPKDILYLIPLKQLVDFCSLKNLSHKGKNKVQVILNSYQNSENLYLQHYTLFAKNDISGLKNQGISGIDVGIEFENTTKTIFKGLGFNVNESLRAKINTNKEKADIVLDLGNDKVIIVECKASKDSYSTFSTVSRQLASYHKHYTENGYTVEKCILASGSFTDDMKQEVDKFYNFDVTLVEAETLVNIHDKFKSLNKREFPFRLFKPGVLSEMSTISALKGK